jgi:hypothetical protein
MRIQARSRACLNALLGTLRRRFGGAAAARARCGGGFGSAPTALGTRRRLWARCRRRFGGAAASIGTRRRLLSYLGRPAWLAVARVVTSARAALRLGGDGRGRRNGPDDTEVAATADLDALANRLGRVRATLGARTAPARTSRTGTAGLPRRDSGGGGHRRRHRGLTRLTNHVRERLKVVGTLLGRVSRQAHHVPAARNDETRRVLLTQVVAVRLYIRGKRTEHSRGVTVHVRERVDGRLLARST